MSSFKYLFFFGLCTLFMFIRNIHGEEYDFHNICTEPNEVWTDCGNNGCVRTCDNLYDPNIPCDESLCVSGCICAPGFLRNRFGVCVTEDKCGEGVCGKNEKYEFCQPCPKGMMCAAVCRGPSVCVCNEGYIRNSRGICYKPTPKQCNQNEVFDICPLPEKTCSHYFKGVEPAGGPIKRCRPNCVCKDGYLRKSNGACVLPENCCNDSNATAVRCPYNCGSGGTCDIPEINRFCRKGCPDDAPIGCECKQGYVKMYDDQSPKKNLICMALKKCPK